MTTQPLKIGFVGLGIMGAPMAGHLIKAGHQLFVFTRGKTPESIASSKATQCTSARGVAERADIVITMVPDTPDVEAVLFADNGIAAGLTSSAGGRDGRDGRISKVVVDMSSISPIATKSFAQKINALGCDYLDAPVSGGQVGAKNATLSIMVGGPEAVFERIRPLFELMGKNITLVGGNGDGQTAKVANQIIVAANSSASATASMFRATMIWLATLAVWPSPLPPTRVMFLPISSNSGLTRSNTASSPPTMMDKAALRAPTSPPETGASR